MGGGENQYRRHVCHRKASWFRRQWAVANGRDTNSHNFAQETLAPRSGYNKLHPINASTHVGHNQSSYFCNTSDLKLQVSPVKEERPKSVLTNHSTDLPQYKKRYQCNGRNYADRHHSSQFIHANRSEERRVGKEGTPRGA